MSLQQPHKSLETVALEYFDDAILLGQELANLKIDSYDLESLPEHNKLYSRAINLSRRTVDLQTLSFTFSGTGYSPFEDVDGELMTVYRHVYFLEGCLENVYLRSSDMMHYSDDSEIETFDFEEDSDEDDNDLSVMIAKLTTSYEGYPTFEQPPEGMRLLWKFALRKSNGYDDPVFGDAIRGGLDFYSWIDLSTIRIENIEPRNRLVSLDTDVFSQNLGRLAEIYRKMIQNKKFRNLDAKKQNKILDSAIARLNSELRPDHYFVESDAAYIFVPNNRSDSPTQQFCITDKTIIAKVLKVDCIEATNVSAGIPITKRKGTRDSNFSLCVVAEIDESTRHQLEIDSNVIWIPINRQIDDMCFYEKYPT